MSADAVERWRARSGVTRPYILWCGTHEPRKNLPALVSAFALLAAGADDPGADLVLVGPPGWGAAAAIPDRIAQRIHTTGFLPPEDLHAAYAGAAAFCYPSLREGFGMPVLEAMAHGVGVVTSMGTPMAEVGGDAAVLVDPRDPASIATGLLRALADPASYGPAGLARSREFTWARAAGELASVYREAAGTSPRSDAT